MAHEQTNPQATESAVRELRRCIETLRPYTGRPIGGEGSPARREQEDRAAAYSRPLELLDAITCGAP